MALKMQVQSSEVVATTGIRKYMGEKVKLNMVAGTQTFQRATWPRGRQAGWHTR